MIKYNLYIGSDNISKELEKVTIIDIVSKWYDGFSCYEIEGYWKGVSEKALKIEIAVEDTDLNTYAIQKLSEELKRLLKQESIMVEKVMSNVSFI